MANRRGKSGSSDRFYFLGLQVTVNSAYSHEIKTVLGRKAMTDLDSILKSRGITLSKKVHIVKGMVFFSSQVWMWELGNKTSWALKNWCFWTVLLEKTFLKSPLDCRDIKPVNPKGNQPWIFIERADAEAPLFWPPDVKSLLIGKNSGAGKDWRQKEKEMAECEMVG